MAPPKKIVKQQQAILIDFLEKNIEMAKGIPVSSPVTSQGMKEKWITLARKLNAVEGGDRKPAQGWKRVKSLMYLLLLFICGYLPASIP